MILKEINICFIRLEYITFTKSDSEDISDMMTHVFFLTLYSSKNSEKNHSFHKNIKQHFHGY